MKSKVKTPCIGICSTGIGDVVCRGCKRFAHEVIDWNSYDDEQQQLVLDRLDQFLTQIVEHKLTVVDEAVLRKSLDRNRIIVDQRTSTSRCIYELLRAGASQIQDPREFGFVAKEEWARFSMEQMKQFIEQDFFNLSSAHYERYIVPHRDRH